MLAVWNPEIICSLRGRQVGGKVPRWPLKPASLVGDLRPCVGNDISILVCCHHSHRTQVGSGPLPSSSAQIPREAPGPAGARAAGGTVQHRGDAVLWGGGKTRPYYRSNLFRFLRDDHTSCSPTSSFGMWSFLPVRRLCILPC